MISLLTMIVIGILAYGINGAYVQRLIDLAIPREVGKLTLQHIAFIPQTGLILKGVAFYDDEGRLLVSCERCCIGVRLLSKATWCDRINAITLDELFVAQIIHQADAEPDEWREPSLDLSWVRLPFFDHVPLRLNNPDVLEVRLKTVTGTLHTQDGKLLFHNLRGDVDGGEQIVDARLDLDVHGGVVSARIRGFIIQTRLNGIYRALDFPIIEAYSDKFSLEQPAWAECSFTVGLDKYRNIFDLTVDIAAKRGAYCGVSFDEAQGKIQCHGVWDTVTVINPIVARRNGKVVASGKLRFDCPNDRFEFEAEGRGLSPSETLRLVDMPFTEAIPEMSSEIPPMLSVKGAIPLLTEQTPSKVWLEGTLTSSGPFVFDQLRFAEIFTTMSMQNGTFSLNNLDAKLPLGGSVKGDVAIKIPDTADYVDITTDATLDNASFADLFQPFGMNTYTDNFCSGSLTIGCRTDETFKTSLQGKIDLKMHGGLIGRIPLFAGFTTLMAEHVPGVSSITDTSTATLQGELHDGVLTLPHFTLFGDLFMIEGPVTYDFPNDNLEAKVIAGIFKKDTVIGFLTRWATVPVTKLLWQVEVNGPIANPNWHNQHIVKKIWDKLPFGDNDVDK